MNLKQIILEVLDDIEKQEKAFGTGMYQSPGFDEDPLVGHT